MAASMGFEGSISALNVMLLARSWSFDWTRDIHDASTFAGGAYDVTLPGIHGLTGRAEGWVDDTTAVDLSSATSFITNGLAFVLTASSGKTYSFSGNFTSFNVDSETNAVVRWNATFESTGVITVA